MEYRNDTIAAVATPPGHGAIAIVRVSGNKALSIGDSIFKGPKKINDQSGHSICYGYIIDPETQSEVDEVLVSVFRSPASFTGEDSIEINCHGGQAIPHRILDLLQTQGCRLALPGEFSKRAFFNGKLDLTQAEAINDIIHSSTLAGSELALANLKKGLSEPLDEIIKKLTYALAKTEAILDYPEEEIGILEPHDIAQLETSINKLENMIQTGERSRKIAAGFKVVLAGQTNVGKSSLLNRLAGEEKAIVSHHHGTTRDVIEVELNLNGTPVQLIDTAGIRDEFEHELEGYGIIKTRELIGKADLVLFINDASRGWTPEDSDILKELGNSNILTGINKIDLAEIDVNSLRKAGVESWIAFSTESGEGLDDLIDAIVKKLEIYRLEDTRFFVNQRQDEILSQALSALKESFELIEAEESYDIVAFELRRGLTILSELTGLQVQEEVISTIFDNFCVGK